VIVLPGSQLIYKTAIQEGLLETLVDAGAWWARPAVAPALEAPGIWRKGKKALSTTNRKLPRAHGASKQRSVSGESGCGRGVCSAGRIGSPEEV